MRQVHTEAEFKKAIVASRVVVVDFYATWCGPCKALTPYLDAMSKVYPSVTFVKVDVDNMNMQDVVHKCAIASMPTIFIYKDGIKKEIIVGMSPSKIEDAIKKHMS